jgi:Caspase domain
MALVAPCRRLVCATRGSNDGRLFGGAFMTLRVLSFIASLSLSAISASAQQATAPAPPLQEPILRIEPGMHTAPIARIGVDKACTLLATASTDKTVRLWRLPHGRLLNTLRPPIGQDTEGQVSAVAVAPDGDWVAVGAIYPSQGASFIYIFQSATGVALTRLGPLNDAGVLTLTTSLDGRHLAAAMVDGGSYNLRVWELATGGSSTWRLVMEDKDPTAQAALAATFDRAGVLYTVGSDGKLRRYAPGGRGKPTSVGLRAGKRPYSLALDPSARSIAVGYEDSAAVDVYDARTLVWRFSADIRRVNRGNLAAVAWSADGKRLYAGGTYPVDKRSSIIVWDKAGKGSFREIVGPRNTIAQLLPCGDGVVMGAQDPAFGLLASDGSRRLWQESAQADLRTQRTEDFSVSADGRRVQFGLEEKGKDSVLFDLSAEHLKVVSKRASDLAVADTSSLPITDWQHNYAPKLRGGPIELDQYEKSRSLAISLDKQRFVLGTEWQLRAYESDGKPLWRKLLLRTAWGVNIARDGKLVVAAYSDGTIRWHRLDDGEELLTLFVHAQDRRWVAWTPKGYYMASPGAEALIGWHVNRGWQEAAQFFPADRFREQFNRPDIVKLVLETLDEGRAIEEANKRANVKPAVEDVRSIAPPAVVIQKPGDNATFRTPEVTLEYDVFSPTGQKITKVDYLINNAALGARFAVPIDSGKFTFSGRVTIPLPPEDVTITVVAYEGPKASEPASIRLRWDGAKPGKIVLPRLRALFVGVNEYTSPKVGRLRFAAKDATDLAAFFKTQEGKSYGKVEAKALPDAKRIDVINGLEWLEKESAEGDVNLLFLAGHGATVEQHFYYMAADSDPEAMRATAISKDEILRTIRNRKGAMVVMLDACHSGASVEAATGASRVDMNRLANELGDQSLGVLLYASARGRQFSFEHADWQNGAFTRAMLDGLAGAADRDKIGYIDTEELSVYVRRRVLVMTKDRQEPVRVKADAAPEMKIVLLK